VEDKDEQQEEREDREEEGEEEEEEEEGEEIELSKMSATKTVSPPYQPHPGECSVESCLANFTQSELLTGSEKYLLSFFFLFPFCHLLPPPPLFISSFNLVLLFHF